jgi:hypothetical protein
MATEAEVAQQNEDVRRIEHPEEFADETPAEKKAAAKKATEADE